MIIKEILQQLETSSHPIAKAIYKGEHTKVLVLAFKKGMVLKEHKANLPTKLTILSGSILYHDIHQQITLEQYDDIDILAGEVHEVTCLEHALCLLTQGE